MAVPMFARIALVGIGLIGSSLAHVIRREGLADHVAISTRSTDTLARAELGLGDSYDEDPTKPCAMPISSSSRCRSAPRARWRADRRQPEARRDPDRCRLDQELGDRADAPHVPAGVHFIPGHPLAGTERSGPDAGFAELFENRWCILTPMPGTDENALQQR
jgi:cyclohexadieny/prephenate dehydrogenase